jgi:copper chaperone CopZ
MRCFILIVAVTLGTHAYALAAEPPSATKATYSITGLHCPPCTRTVESSLKRVKGVKTAKVDWNTKTAKVEFDESVLPAAQVAQWIATTPHMMGGNMHYTGWLSMKVPELKDEASAAKVKSALESQKGVKRVVVYPVQHAVNIEFAADGKVTTQQLIDAVKEAGVVATTN